MNTQYRKPLPGTALDYFDTREAIEAIAPGAYAKLPYTSRVLAENLVRRCEPQALTDSLKQIIESKQELDFPWFPARVVCHDILGQTALVDLAGLRDAIAEVHGLNPANILCGNGSGELLALLANIYLGPGDEAIITEHGFLLYRIQILASGGMPVTVKETDRRVDVDAILAAVTERT